MTEPARPSAGTIAAEAAAPAASDPPAPRAARAALHAPETRRLYAADWAAFAAWGRARQHALLPAAPGTVAAYLGSLAATLSPGALARRAAAIGAQHRRAGHPPPGADPAVRAVLQAARRAAAAAGPPAPAAPARRRPPGPGQLARMAARCPGDLAGLRDRALLLLAAAGFGGERLLALDVEHVRFTAAGVALAGSGPAPGAAPEVVVGRVAASAACPVRALEAWLHGSETRFGPVFRKVDRWGTVEHGRLRADGLRRIWQRRAQALRIGHRSEGAPA